MEFDRRVTLLLVIIFLLLLIIVGFERTLVTYRSAAQTNQAVKNLTSPKGHGGPCDDQIYYQAHVQSCSVQ